MQLVLLDELDEGEVVTAILCPLCQDTTPAGAVCLICQPNPELGRRCKACKRRGAIIVNDPGPTVTMSMSGQNEPPAANPAGHEPPGKNKA